MILKIPKNKNWPTNSLLYIKPPHFRHRGEVGQLSKKKRAICWSDKFMAPSDPMAIRLCTQCTVLSFPPWAGSLVLFTEWLGKDIFLYLRIFSVNNTREPAHGGKTVCMYSVPEFPTSFSVPRMLQIQSLWEAFFYKD